MDNNKGTCQKLLSGFFSVKGGVPPLSAKLFWAQWLSVKGGTPNSVKEKNAKKTAIFGQKTLILALFGPFFREIFWRRSVNGKNPLSSFWWVPSKSVSKDIFKRNCCRILTQSKQRPSRPYPLPDCYWWSFQSSPYVQQAKPWRRNYQVLHHTHCLPLKISFFREKEFHQFNKLASQLDSLWCQWSPGDIKDSQRFQHLRQMVQ